jgi:membrane-bound inhibitor of C-type lysozyme
MVLSHAEAKMRGRFLALMLCAAGFVGPVAPALAQTVQTYQCSNGIAFDMTIFASRRTSFVNIEGHRLLLKQRIFALPGSKRYSKSGISITTRGQTARLKRGGKSMDCEIVQPN